MKRAHGMRKNLQMKKLLSTCQARIFADIELNVAEMTLEVGDKAQLIATVSSGKRLQ